MRTSVNYFVILITTSKDFILIKNMLIVSAEMLQQIPSLKYYDDINKFQKYIQRTHKISYIYYILIYYFITVLALIIYF